MKKSKYLVFTALLGLVLAGCKPTVTPEPGPGPEPEPTPEPGPGPEPEPTPDWPAEVKALMNQKLGFELPYVELANFEWEVEDGEVWLLGDYSAETVEAYSTVLAGIAEEHNFELYETELLSIIEYDYESYVEGEGLEPDVYTEQYFGIEFKEDDPEQETAGYTCIYFDGEIVKYLKDWTEDQKAAMEAYYGVVFPFVPGATDGDAVIDEDGEFFFSFKLGEDSQSYVDAYAASIPETWKFDEEHEIWYTDSAVGIQFVEDGTVYPAVVYLNTYVYTSTSSTDVYACVYGWISMAVVEANEWPTAMVEELFGNVPAFEGGTSYVYQAGYDDYGDVAALIDVYGEDLSIDEYLTSLAAAHFHIEDNNAEDEERALLEEDPEPTPEPVPEPEPTPEPEPGEEPGEEPEPILFSYTVYAWDYSYFFYIDELKDGGIEFEFSVAEGEFTVPNFLTVLAEVANYIDSEYLPLFESLVIPAAVDENYGIIADLIQDSEAAEAYLDNLYETDNDLYYDVLFYMYGYESWVEDLEAAKAAYDYMMSLVSVYGFTAQFVTTDVDFAVNYDAALVAAGFVLDDSTGLYWLTVGSYDIGTYFVDNGNLEVSLGFAFFPVETPPEPGELKVTADDLFIEGTTSYSGYAGDHTFGDLTINMSDVLVQTVSAEQKNIANYPNAEHVFQFKASTGKMTVTVPEGATKITLLMVSSYDYGDNFTVNGQKQDNDVVNAERVDTGVQNGNGYELYEYTLVYVFEEAQTSFEIVNTAPKGAQYIVNFIIE